MTETDLNASRWYKTCRWTINQASEIIDALVSIRAVYSSEVIGIGYQALGW